MIATVTLNPCVDLSLCIANFTHGGMNRVQNIRSDVAGKGLNVSVALKNLGIESVCFGINYLENASIIENFLNGLDIAHDFIQAPGVLRTNIKILEEDTGIMTELNQPGAYVCPGLVDELLEKLTKAEPEILVLSGSRPQGVGADIYKRIMEAYKGKTILDTEGEALRTGLSATHPTFMLKPNLFELESTFGKNFRSKEEIAAFCAQLIEKKGIYCMVVSLGKEGALLIAESNAWFAPSIPVPVRGAQGAGDSMVAGMIYAYKKNFPPEEILRCAVAAASASIMREGTLLCTKEGFEEMVERVVLES